MMIRTAGQKLRYALLCALLGGLFTGCSKTEPPKLDEDAPTASSPFKISVCLDWYPEAELGGFYQAAVKGYYRDAGLDVTIVDGGVGAFPVPKLATGGTQFCAAASDEIIMDVAHGMPLVIVGAFLQHYPEGVMVREESPIRTFADFGGTTVIGVPGAGWIAHVQKKYGIHFNIIPMGYEITRFLSDPSVIQQCYITNEPYYVSKTKVRARTLLISDSGYDPYRVIVTNQRFLREHPDIVRRFVDATLRGWYDFAYNDPKPGIDEILRRNSKTDREFVSASVATMNSFKIIAGDARKGELVGKMTPERISEQISLLAGIKNIDEVYPVDRVASFAFSHDGIPAPTR